MHEWKKNVCAGIFVGGRAQRMNGQAKGLLVAPSGQSIVERFAVLFRSLGIDHVFVGRQSAYAGLGVTMLADAPDVQGPLAGLLALLEWSPTRYVIATACDMPFVSEGLLQKLVAAPDAPIVAPRRDERWEPFFARYEATRVYPLAKARMLINNLSLQGLLDEAKTCELPCNDHEFDELRDWDTPADIEKGHIAR